MRGSCLGVAAGRGDRFTEKEFEMNDRKLENGLALAGTLVVLLSLMFATALAVNTAPLGV